MGTFERLKKKIHSTHNSNFHFNKIDWAASVWIKGLCELIDEEKALKEYKKQFVSHIVGLGADKEFAENEVEAHIENVGLTDLGDPIQDADECLDYYND